MKSGCTHWITWLKKNKRKKIISKGCCLFTGDNCPCWVNSSSVRLCFKILHKELDTIHSYYSLYIHIVPTRVLFCFFSFSLFLTNRKWNPNFPRQRKFTGHKLQKRIWIKVLPLFGNPVHPSLQRKGELCPIIINTYFRVFPRSPTHSLCLPDNWPFNGSPQYDTVCAQADCNQSPSFQRDNSYLFSAERIDPLPIPTRSMCRGYLLLLITVVCFHLLPGLLKCRHCMLLKRAKTAEQGWRTKSWFSHFKKGVREKERPTDWRGSQKQASRQDGNF